MDEEIRNYVMPQRSSATLQLETLQFMVGAFTPNGTISFFKFLFDHSQGL